jgi:hypothetical protein
MHMMKWVPAICLSLTAITSISANALDLPWDEPVSGKTTQYCTGFVVGGLASKQVSGVSRTQLWLAWNYVIRAGALGLKGELPEEFQSGRAQFQSVADNRAAENVMQHADGDCGLGRSGHQITGW